MIAEISLAGVRFERLSRGVTRPTGLSKQRVFESQPPATAARDDKRHAHDHSAKPARAKGADRHAGF